MARLRNGSEGRGFESVVLLACKPLGVQGTRNRRVVGGNSCAVSLK